MRDIFFDEFYAELKRVVAGVAREEDEREAPPLLKEEVQRRWRPYLPDQGDRPEVLVSVDGGVQFSNFAYGRFVAVGRACALVHQPGEEGAIEKRVKIYIGDVYDDRDRSYIPSYVRMIAEYEAARAAARRVLDGGGRPLVVLDGALYFSRFPYAIREYRHHPELLAELFTSITALHTLSGEGGFPVVGVAKDSTVFYLHMRLLKDAAARFGLGRLASLLEEASSPLDLLIKMAGWEPEYRRAMEPLIEARPLCDTALVGDSVSGEGYTLPLLLAPSIYYGREGTAALYGRVRRTIDPRPAERVISALRAFFRHPGVAVTYWRPIRGARPFRVDVSAAALGYRQPWEERKRNMFVEEGRHLSDLERVLNHLGFWFCNEVEYNLPLHQADMIARFDRGLYRSKYEPFIVRRLEEAGFDVRGRRRTLREVGA
ncbi:MAG: DNA double-strand break repair nuclease NurA [Candidatus Bathyarchaeia archaeon]